MSKEYRPLSFWHDSLPGPLTPRTALDADRQADVVIVGAGYTGLWTAWYLKQADPGLDIAIVEAEIAGFGASGRNGGWCSSHLSGIHHWLKDPDRHQGALRLQRLMFQTVADVGKVVQNESIDCHFEQSGCLDIAVLPQQLIRLEKEWEELRSLGFGQDDYRWLDTHETSGMVRIEGALGALFLKHCAAIHPARLARGLADAVERKGVRIYEGSPVLSMSNGELLTPQGKIRGETILLSTEGYTPPWANSDRRLIPVHSMMVATEPLTPEQLEATGLTRRCTFGNGDRVVTYGQLTADGRIAFGCRGTYLFGSGVRRNFDSADADFQAVRKTLLRFFPALEGIGFTHAWGGAMGVSRGLRASVNFDAGRRLGWAGGYFGSGVAATHLAGQTLADLVTGRDTERVHTPWVNPPEVQKSWEPEPLRWLGIRYARAMMTLADRLEYRGGRVLPALGSLADRLRPEL